MKTYSIKYTQCGGSKNLNNMAGHIEDMTAMTDNKSLKNILSNVMNAIYSDFLVSADNNNITTFLNLKYENKTYHDLLLELFENDGTINKNSDNLKYFIIAFMAINKSYSDIAAPAAAGAGALNLDDSALIIWLRDLHHIYERENQEWMSKKDHSPGDFPSHIGARSGPPVIAPGASASAAVYAGPHQTKYVHGEPAVIKIINGDEFITLNRNHAIELEIKLSDRDTGNTTPNGEEIGKILFNFGESQRGENKEVTVDVIKWTILMNYVHSLSGQPIAIEKI
jgi:hypothetical protein